MEWDQTRTIPLSTLQYQDYQFQVSLPCGAWKWVTRIDVSQSTVSTEVRDIVSPYGLLRDSIPIPGEVVQAMADSIVEMLLAYRPSILLAPLTLDFVVDEGRGVSEAKSVTVTNNGILGSLLAVTITSSAAYVAALPANIGGLASNESGRFDVSVDSASLLAINSPYSATLTVQSSSATNSPQTVAVNIVVRPLSEITVLPTSLTFNVAKPLTGPYPPIPSQQINLTNSGPPTSVLDYQIRQLVGSTWLTSYSPVYGSLNGGASQPITVTVAPSASLASGSYNETLRFTGYSSNMSVDVPVTLNIT